MRMSRKCEYSLLVLCELARLHGEGEPVSNSQLAQRFGIPRQFLDQIMNFLKKSGYVQSTRGAGGGYRLAKEPETVSLADIVRLVDGPIAPVASVSEYFYAHTPIEQSEKLLACFQDIRDYSAKKLESMTLDKLI